MKKIIFIIVGFCFVFFYRCDKEDINANWSSAVEGTYVGTAFFNGLYHTATTIFTSINDTILNLQLSVTGDSFCLDSVFMKSSTTFIINEYDGCYLALMFGSGKFMGDTVGYTLRTDSTIAILFDGNK